MNGERGGARDLVVGVFVGGASRRMGGRPKGWLLAPRGPHAEGPRVSVLERTVGLARGIGARVVLVGRAEAYAALGVPTLADAVTAGDERAEGPLAGLVALLEEAREAAAIALACDMPYLTAAMLERLASFAPEAVAVAPREAGESSVWSPFFARYDAAHAADVARAKLETGERSLRAVLEGVATCELPLSPEERLALRDWDTPGDVDDLRNGP